MANNEVTARLWQAILDTLFPPRCVGCGVRGEWLCPGCIERAPRAPAPVSRPGPALAAIVSVYAFEGAVRAATHRLKYRRGRHLAPTLASLLDASYAELEPLLPAPPDAIVPVPLHPRHECASPCRSPCFRPR